MESWPRTWETQKSRKRKTRVKMLGPGTKANSPAPLQFWGFSLNIAVYLAFFVFLYPVISQLAYSVYKSVTREIFFFQTRKAMKLYSEKKTSFPGSCAELIGPQLH